MGLGWINSSSHISQPHRHQVLRVVPQSDEELQKVQELQDLEHLQVLGVEMDSGDTPSKAGMGLDVG